MVESILDRITPRRETIDSKRTDESECLDDLGAFGWLRGVKDRAIMLELRRRDGSIVALNYAWLERADFDPSTGIALEFARALVRIKGRNLNQEIRQSVQLFSGIIRHRVPWIQEADSASVLVALADETLIDLIELT